MESDYLTPVTGDGETGKLGSQWKEALPVLTLPKGIITG